MFANVSEDQGSIPGRVIPKTQKMVLDVTSLNTQHFKVRVNGNVEQSIEWSSAFLHLSVVTIEKGVFRSPLIAVGNFTYICHTTTALSCHLTYHLLDISVISNDKANKEKIIQIPWYKKKDSHLQDKKIRYKNNNKNRLQILETITIFF